MSSEFLMDNIILRVEVGSTAHGTGIPGYEDRDEMAISIEPLEYTFGLRTAETYVYRPGRGPTDPSGPDDLDLVVYPLRKFMRLALSANPSIMMMFWSNILETTPLGDSLRKSSDRFISKRLFERHLGYAEDQIKRMKDGKFNASRAQIVEEFGYDTKFAMHALRLILQGRELAHNGSITLPIPNPIGDLLRDVRRGKYSEEEFYNMYEYHADLLRLDEERSTLPESPDEKWVDDFLIDAYFYHWGIPMAYV
jgi:uncharacterized protein